MYYVIILLLSATPECVAFGDEYKNINFFFFFFSNVTPKIRPDS